MGLRLTRIKSPLLYQLSYRVGDLSNFTCWNHLDNSLRHGSGLLIQQIVLKLWLNLLLDGNDGSQSPRDGGLTSCDATAVRTSKQSFTSRSLRAMCSRNATSVARAQKPKATSSRHSASQPIGRFWTRRTKAGRANGQSQRTRVARRYPPKSLKSAAQLA
jgi:hypothetical protein